MSLSWFVHLLVRPLIATTVLFAAFAAYSAPSDGPDFVQAPELGCGETASPSQSAARLGAELIPCAPQEPIAEQDDRAYLVATASPGDTMMRQGPEVAIGRLHPQFVARLADAIREARQSGLPSAGIFSAYRPPGFGIGGFADKFNSLHAYGLAVDMFGIGDPGSSDAQLWHAIAARHGVICPYGFASRTEWNHCQATPLAKVSPGEPLRRTITADGPVNLAAMFRVGASVIADLAAAIDVAEADNNQKGSVYRVAAASTEEVDREHEHRTRNHSSSVLARAGRRVKAKAIMVAKNEERPTERSHDRRHEEAKGHGVHKAARAHVERREPPHRRSHVV